MIDVTTGNRYYYYYDGAGSVVALSNNNAIVEAYCYDAFGRFKISLTAGPDGNWLTPDSTQTLSTRGNRFMFTGREYDSETGLYYYRARMYSPVLGRFMQPDPIGYADSMNLYQYCGNNPVNFIDPWGLTGADPYNGGAAMGANPELVGKEVAEEAAKECSKGFFQKLRDLFFRNGKKSLQEADDAAKKAAEELEKKAIQEAEKKAAEEEAKKKLAEELARKVANQKTAVQKINNIAKNNLKPSDFRGVAKDIAGNPVKKAGGVKNHLQEMQESRNGLQKALRYLDGATDPEMVAARNKALELLDKINKTIGSVE